MTTELQEQFKNYVFEDVKANIDEWDSIGNFGRYYVDKKANQKFRDKIIEMRRLFAKENGLKTVTQLCPKPSGFMDAVRQFMDEYILRERARITEEYKPLAIAKVVNDEELKDRMNTALVKGFSEYKFYGSYGNRTLFDSYGELRDFIQEYYDEIKHTLSNPSNVTKPYLGDLANELLTSLFTSQLVLKTNSAEQIKEAS